VKCVQGRKRWWPLRGGEAHQGLLLVLTEDKRNQSNVQSMGHERHDLRWRKRRKHVGDSCLVTLATLGCHIPHHDVLAVSLAAVFCHVDSPDAFLKAGQAHPREK